MREVAPADLIFLRDARVAAIGTTRRYLTAAPDLFADAVIALIGVKAIAIPPSRRSKGKRSSSRVAAREFSKIA
jgi:hypothetical protein